MPGCGKRCLLSKPAAPREETGHAAIMLTGDLLFFQALCPRAREAQASPLRSRPLGPYSRSPGAGRGSRGTLWSLAGAGSGQDPAPAGLLLSVSSCPVSRAHPTHCRLPPTPRQQRPAWPLCPSSPPSVPKASYLAALPQAATSCGWCRSGTKRDGLRICTEHAQ